MKKFMLIGAALSVIFFACSKKDDNTNVAPTKSYDASSLTASSVASRGTIVKGALPTASTAVGTPVLSGSIAEDTYSAIAGRYLVIPLTLNSGEIKGAYVQFQGADSYFNVDFSKKANGRVANQRSVLGRSVYGDSHDSVVIIKVPADVATGTVKVLISVYDKSGNASQSITISANLFNTAGSSDSKALSGKWSLVRSKEVYKDNTVGDWEDPYVYHYNSYFYTCNNGKLSYTSDSTVNGAVKIAGSYWKTLEQYVQLNADGSGKTAYNDSTYTLRDDNTCSSRNYDGHADSGSEVVGWYYNATTKKFYVIGDVITIDAKDFYIEEYDAKVENGKLIITDEYGSITEFTKK